MKQELKKIIAPLKKFTGTIVILLLGLYILSGIYAIKQNEIGVLLRFGKVIDSNIRPGIHYLLPWPVDKIYKVPVKEIKRMAIDDFAQNYSDNSSADIFTQLTGLLPYCITGDNNIVSISCTVQYSIVKPDNYLFKFKNNEMVLRNIICNTVIRSIASKTVDECLTFGKKQIGDFIRIEAQKKITGLGLGVMINFVEIKFIIPPDQVQEYFDDVINAKIDRRKMKNQALADKNERIPAAKAKANRTIEKANAYKNDVIKKAEGETKRFMDMLSVYRKSKSITKQRLYIEFIKEIFPEVQNKYIISNKDKKSIAKIKISSKGIK